MVDCQGDQQCFGRAVQSLPPAELQWLSSFPDAPSACPGLANLQDSDEARYCHAGAHLAPAMLAVKSVTLTDYGATETCSFSGGGESCDIPNIRTGCCDLVHAMVDCQGDQQCFGRAVQSLPPAELQWLSSFPDAPSACPGLANLQDSDEARYCHAGAHSSVLLPVQLALKSVPVAKSMNLEQSSWAPGLLGFIAGAAVVSAVVTLKQKRTSSDMYAPLVEETA